MSSEKTQIAKLSLEEKVKLFRKRFVCRQDAFYTKRIWETLETDPVTNEKIKTQKNNFRVQCANDGDQKLCLIAQGKGKCFQCDNKVRTVLDDSWCRKHINGSETLCLVPITPDGSKFGAIDFDRSIEEGLKYVFEDAKTVRDFALTKGITSYIARSSNKGFHLYFFFDDWTSPVELQSFLCYLLAQTGFVTRQTTHSMPLPEMFPKQFEFRSDSEGSGIRVPFSDPDMRKGRNCFVDDNMVAYPLDHQWDHLAKAIENSAAAFQKLLIDEKVVIHTGGVGTSGPRKKKAYLKKADGTTEETEDSEEISNEKPKQRGSFWNVVAACPALKEYWTKGPNGKYAWDDSNPKGLFNSARVASMNIALASLDGEEVIKKRWPTPQTERQIEGAKHLGYKPCTCRWMQMQGVCHTGKHPKFGSHCFNKIPPLGVVEGKIVENPDKLPESEWDSPSPVRHITDKNLSLEEIKEKLTLLCNAIKNQAKKDAGEPVKVERDIEGRPIIKEQFAPENPSELLSELVKQIMRRSKKDKDSAEQHVTLNKLLSKAVWNAMVKSAGGEVNDEKQIAEAESHKNFLLKGKTYLLEDDCIICMHADQKGVMHKEKLWNFWIERTDEPATIKLVEINGEEKVTYDDRNYNLTIHICGQSRRVEMTNKIFSNSGSFFEAVRKAGGTELTGPMSSKDDYDVHMSAISYFSEVLPERHALKDIGYYSMKGGMKYIMPSVIVTRDEIVKNDAYLIKMDSDYSKPLDFQIYDTDKFKVVGRHILDDLFNCNSRKMVITTFAHAMAAVCTKPIEIAKGWRKSPVLWVCGNFGDGKTFVFENIQYFFGNFSKSGPSGAGGSYVAKIGAANLYRHVVLMFEDYKAELEKDGGIAMKKFVQNAYDRVGNPALKRDGTMRTETARARGLIAVSAEDILEREASAVSRLVLVDGKYEGRLKEGGKVLNMNHFYSGFTPYVIKQLLQLDNEAILNLWNDCYIAVAKGLSLTKARAGGNRICENYALNLFGLKIALDTMAFYGVLIQEEVNKIMQEHIENLIEMRDHQLNLVFAARASTSFIEDLQSLLADPTRYHISGWTGLEGLDTIRNSRALGFFVPEQPDTLFIDMNLAHAAVSETAARIRNPVKSKSHVLRQLLDDDIIMKSQCDKGRNTCRRRNFFGQLQLVTPIKAEALGFTTLSIVKPNSNKTPVVNTRVEEEIALD